MKTITYSCYRNLVLVCTNDRVEGVCCKKRGSSELYQKLKARVKAEVSFVRVSQTRCLGHCLSGSTVVIMPDNVWLGEVEDGDIDEIVEMLHNG